MRSLLACVAAIALNSVAMACPPISVYPQLSGNVTIGNESYFAFRASSAEVVNIPFAGGLGVYSSYSVANAPGSGQEVDVIAARLAAGNLVFPTAAIAWFDAQDNYNVTFDNSSINASVNAGVFASAMSTIFDKVFEFEDSNNDGSYTPNVDRIVSTQSLFGLGWNNMCDLIQKDNPLTIFNITSSTLFTPFQFGIQTYLSDVIGVTSNGALVTPRTMKIDLLIKDYPYQGTVNKTYLGLSAYILSAQANASVTAAFNADTSVAAGSGDAQMSFSWLAQAQVDDEVKNVIASGLTEAKADLGGIGLAADFFFSGLAGASVDAKKIYFTFPSVRPKSVYWDPTMGAGVPPQTGGSSSSISRLALGLIVGLGAFALIVISYITFRYCKRRAETRAETESLVDNASYARAADI